MRVTKVCCGALLGLVLAISGAQAKDLGDILLKKGLITEDELRQAREEDKQKSAAEESRRDAIAAKLPKWLEAITPFGDLRTRYEGFFQPNRVAENRFRYRARFGLNVNPAEEIGGTVRLATGDPNNPVTRNQTLNNTFTQKNINLDQAYLTVKPGKTFGIEPGWVTATLGKFGVNAYRTSELIWDDDLTPEGATETLNLIEERQGFMRGLKVNAFQWVVDEVAANSDPWMGGGQIVADTAWGTVANLTVAFSDFHYSNLNAVARKFLSPSSSNQNKQLATTNSLLVVRDSTGKVTKINGFREGFNLVHGGTELAFPTVLPVPAGLYGDAVYNTQAGDGKNVGFYVGVGMGSSGKDYYHDSFLKNPGDWGVSYTFAWVEKDSTLALFNYDDISYSQGTFSSTQTGSSVTGGTNIIGHIARFDYLLFPALQLTWKTHFINALDASPDQRFSVVKYKGDPTLVRTQVDALLKF